MTAAVPMAPWDDTDVDVGHRSETSDGRREVRQAADAMKLARHARRDAMPDLHEGVRGRAPIEGGEVSVER